MVNTAASSHHSECAARDARQSSIRSKRRRPTVWRGTREGFGLRPRSRTVQVTLAMMAVFASICFNFNILLAAAAKTTLDARAPDIGIISAAFGAGAWSARSLRRAVRDARWRTMLLRARLRHLRAAARTGTASSPLRLLLFVCGCSSRASPRTRTRRSSSARTTSAAASSGSYSTPGTDCAPARPLRRLAVRLAAGHRARIRRRWRRRDRDDASTERPRCKTRDARPSPAAPGGLSASGSPPRRSPEGLGSTPLAEGMALATIEFDDVQKIYDDGTRQCST